MTVKDRVAKVAPEVRPRPPKKGAGEELSALQTAMVAAEVKVADWLAQNEIPLARTESVDRVVEDDGESVKSDVPVQLKSLKGKTNQPITIRIELRFFRRQVLLPLHYIALHSYYTMRQFPKHRLRLVLDLKACSMDNLHRKRFIVKDYA